MFEKLYIREFGTGNGADPLDLGFLAEALLFYQQVYICGGPLAIEQMIAKCDPETVLELMQRGWLKFLFTEDRAAVLTKHQNPHCHSLIVTTENTFSVQNVVPGVVERIIQKRGRSRRVSLRLLQYIEEATFERDAAESIKKDFRDRLHLERSLRQILAVTAPQYLLPQNVVEDLQISGESIILKTNIDFEAVNRSPGRPRSDIRISESALLVRLAASRTNLEVASRGGGELAVNPIDSAILQAQVANLIARREASGRSIGDFQQFLLEDGKAIQTTINSGQRSFRELIKILEKAARFKEWLKEQKPDTELAKAYFKEVSKDCWIDKLPNKVLRWALVTLTGALIDQTCGGGMGAVGGLALSSFDAFLLDRLAKGWRPNQFVDGTLKAFLG